MRTARLRLSVKNMSEVKKMSELGLFGFLDPVRGSDFLSVAFKLTLAMIAGGIIGLERRRKRRPAGFRTHILVCMGAALAFCINLYIYDYILPPDYSRVDISRLGAQVINGIGFLGAGTIMVTGRQQVKGLTTAAGLWASACMGLAIGTGYFECAVLACLFIYLTITLFNNLEKVLTSRTRNINLSVTASDTVCLRRVTEQLTGMNCKIFDVEIVNIKELDHEPPRAIIEMRQAERGAHSALIAAVAAIDGVVSVEEP